MPCSIHGGCWRACPCSTDATERRRGGKRAAEKPYSPRACRSGIVTVSAPSGRADAAAGPARTVKDSHRRAMRHEASEPDVQVLHEIPAHQVVLVAESLGLHTA